MKRKNNKSAKQSDLIKLVKSYQNDEQLKRGISIIEANIKAGAIIPSKYFKNGDSVKLNIEAITSDPDWNKKSKGYREYCLSHSNDTFTVVLDPKYGNEPSVVGLLNNGVNSIWNFHVGDLIFVKENPSI